MRSDRKTSYAILIGAIAGLLLLALPWLLPNPYYLYIVILTMIYALVVLGLNLLSGYTGQVSMGQAGFYAVGAYVTGLLMLNFGVSFWLAAGALLGAFLLTAFSELLRVFQSFRLILYGLILILSVIFMPQGLAGLPRSLGARRRQKGKGASHGS